VDFVVLFVVLMVDDVIGYWTVVVDYFCLNDSIATLPFNGFTFINTWYDILILSLLTTSKSRTYLTLVSLVV